MPDAEPDWDALIANYAAARPGPTQAQTYIRKWGSASKPVLLTCDDGHAYVVKGGHAGRQIVNDQVVGQLGQALGAPGAPVTVVEVAAELIAAEPELQNLNGAPMAHGIWHGSRHIAGVSEDRQGFDHMGLPDNRPRFARLALLYGWAGGSDHQFLYGKAPPELVYSVDHGHFFAGGPDWTEASLAGAGPAVPDPTICATCALTAPELDEARQALQALDAPAVIARAVAAPLDTWTLTPAERVALARYLHRRYQDLVAPPPAPGAP